MLRYTVNAPAQINASATAAETTSDATTLIVLDGASIA
jgi:hypothetical protein